MYLTFVAAANGSTPRVRILQLDAMGNVNAWQGTMMANVPTLTDAMLATGEIVMDEVLSDDGTKTGVYKGEWPAALTTAGVYTLQLRFAGVHSASREVYSTGTVLASSQAELPIDGKTLQEALQIIGAMAAGKITTAGTGTEIFKGLDGLTTRVTVTVDSTGNRSVVVYA